MFSAIKNTILNVTKNVSFLNIEERNNNILTKKINLEAGFDILSHFQKNWEIIHAANEENARNADEAAKRIESFANKIKTDKENCELILHLLTSKLKTGIQKCTKQFEELYECCDLVEKDLAELEGLIEKVDLEKRKQEHSYYLEQYKIRKAENFEKLKTELEENYQKAVEQHESAQKSIQQERQKVFQDAFKSDLEHYKSLGTVPKLDLPRKQTSALLEEIEIDYDQSELDQFFEEENLPNKVTNPI